MSKSPHETLKTNSTCFKDKLLYHCDVQTQYVYESNEHSKNLMSSMNEQRKHGILCDMTVVVQGTQIKAHRAVLASCSSYFNKVIMDPENLCHNIVLKLSNVSKLALECLLDFAYTSKLTISKKNVSEVLHAVKVLDMKNIELKCLSLIKQKLFESAEIPHNHAIPSKSSEPVFKSYQDSYHQDITSQNFLSSPNYAFGSETCKLKGSTQNGHVGSVTKCYQNNVIDLTKNRVEKSKDSFCSLNVPTNNCPAIANLKFANSSPANTKGPVTQFPCNIPNCCMLENNKSVSDDHDKRLENHTVNDNVSNKKNPDHKYVHLDDKICETNMLNNIKKNCSMETTTCISFRDSNARNLVMPETCNQLISNIK